MLTDEIESIAANAYLEFTATAEPWRYAEDWPHISEFEYTVRTPDDDRDELDLLGVVSGYRIAQDWTIDHDLQLWEEADALDGDVVRYVESMMREARVLNEVFRQDFCLSLAQHITIVKHVQLQSAAPQQSIRDIVATLALMDAPALMLVDPWPYAEERQSASGKLKGRAATAELLQLGFVRMVASRFVWSWNREFNDGFLAGYDYERLVAARKRGVLDTILSSPLDPSHASLSPDVARMLDVPSPDELTEE